MVIRAGFSNPSKKAATGCLSGEGELADGQGMLLAGIPLVGSGNPDIVVRVNEYFGSGGSGPEAGHFPGGVNLKKDTRGSRKGNRIFPQAQGLSCTATHRTQGPHILV